MALETREAENTPNGEVIILKDRRTSAHRKATLDNAVEKARLFLETFGVQGAPFTSETFDAWAFKHELLKKPESEDKDSGAWKLHISKRGELRTQINVGGRHPSLGLNQFRIVRMTGQKAIRGKGYTRGGISGTYMVERLMESIRNIIPEIGRRTVSYVASVRADTEKAINSIDFYKMNLRDQIMLEVVLNKMQDDQEALSLSLEQSRRRIDELLAGHEGGLTRLPRSRRRKPSGNPLG